MRASPQQNSQDSFCGYVTRGSRFTFPLPVPRRLYRTHTQTRNDDPWKHSRFVQAGTLAAREGKQAGAGDNLRADAERARE
ncbi:MAG: hypothetical protein WB460_09760, partial [Candidatus Acidiferrales bacterium]